MKAADLETKVRGLELVVYELGQALAFFRELFARHTHTDAGTPAPDHQDAAPAPQGD